MKSVQESVRCSLITGASGFVGRRLCAALQARRTRVRALARHVRSGPWDEFAAVDLAVARLQPGALADVDTVFHLAARTHALADTEADAARYRRLNVEATRGLLDVAVHDGVRRFIFLSSVKALGEGSAERLDESSPEQPVTAYGRSKLEAERLVHAAGQAHGLHTVVLRLPLVYGPGVKGNLRRMLEAVERGRFPPLPECGNRRSLVHVDDVVAAARLVSQSAAAAGRTYIVTDGLTYSTRGILDLMGRACGRQPARWSIPLAALRGAAALGSAAGALLGRRLAFDRAALDKLIGSACYDSARIEQELGFQPRHTLEGALAEMVAELRETQ